MSGSLRRPARLAAFLQRHLPQHMAPRSRPEGAEQAHRHDAHEALTAAREAMRGKDVEHIWSNYPAEPCVTLGELIDQALKA
jgi:hypothetical protein